MKKIIASGPVIVEDGKLLVSRDKKDPFYKIPGGTIEDGATLEETCMREFNEETGFECVIIKKLHTQKLNKNPRTGEPMEIELHHYECKLKQKVKNYNSFQHDDHEVRWLNIEEIKQGKYNVAPNILFLIEKGDIK